MTIAVLIGIVLVLLTFFIHQVTFTALARSLVKGTHRSRPKLYLLMLSIFTVHFVEILLYALAYFLAETLFEIGSLEGERAIGPLGYFYASAVFYTSLGLGDVLPNDHLRFITSIEALNGLLLIAWSASFLVTVMGWLEPGLIGAARVHRDYKEGNNKTKI